MVSLDRDLNAAINLRNNYKTVTTTGIACGDSTIGDVQFNCISRYDSMKQELESIETQNIKSLD